MNLKNQVVLITGASSGIGESLAREFAKKGTNLVLCARRIDRLQTLATELKSHSIQVLVEACDVTQDSDLERVTQRARELFGKIDIVIANAGFGVAGKVERLKLEDYRRQFETNIFGVLRTIYTTLEDLKKSKGSLVLLGSVAGYISLPGSSAYGMSKFAIHALAESLTPELQPHGVSVTLIAPGFVDSEIRMVDNHGNHIPGTPDPIPAYLRVPTDQAAREIIRAITARKEQRIITGHGKIIVFIKRHFPWVIGILTRTGLRGRAEP